MIGPADSLETTKRLEHALDLVRQDRWVLGGLRDGRLRVIAESNRWPGGRRPRRRELSANARRCLYERRPLAVASVGDGDRVIDDDHWEEDWPALLYSPVGAPGLRPVGLLVLGSKRPHWYEPEDVDYVGTLAVSLTAWVAMAMGPLGRLNPEEQHVARLLREELSIPEIARALHKDRERTQAMIGEVLQKLSIKSRTQIKQLMPDRIPSSNGFLI